MHSELSTTKKEANKSFFFKIDLTLKTTLKLLFFSFT